jgi:cyclophilin family peptidyl-prolyl cis-trans isomerase/HEAT repeat protein
MKLLLIGAWLAGAGLLAPPLEAQDEAVVEQLAPILAAEDARDWQPDLFQKALVAPDSQVRRIAALAAGRIGDQRATPLLLQVLDQPDSTVRVAAAFALGLLHDSAAVEPLIRRLTALPPLDTATADEAVTALAKIGGTRAADFFGSVLRGEVTLTQSDPEPARTQMLLETWRFGPDARADALLPYADDTVQSVRWRTIYSLGRLRAPGAASQLIAGLRAEDADTRTAAARALTRAYADSAHIALRSVTALLSHALDDDDPGVKVNALRSLGSFRDSLLASAVAPRLNDPDPNVRVQAAAALAELGGSAARTALLRATAPKSGFALRREALLGLARIDPHGFTRAAEAFRTAADWRERAMAAAGWALAGAGGSPWFLSDRDGRVIAAGLQAWADTVTGADPALLSAARRVIAPPDTGARSVAADALARAADPSDLPALTEMFTRSLRDSFPDASLSALAAVSAIHEKSEAASTRVEREFLERVPRPSNYLLRAWADSRWPEASARWGAAYPLATGRTLQDYRELARQYLVAPDSIARPHVFIETAQQGVIEVELLGPDAPLTVANFLRLVERRFFDGDRWHRVVPDFVVQDGDPRGDGFGGPGGAIRDEINRNRYGIKPVLGMALSGPDSGSSQWFINLSPQPHLDGTYTVFGRVVANEGALSRITQGDVIRAIHR